jgi:hypothetical protein
VRSTYRVKGGRGEGGEGGREKLGFLFNKRLVNYNVRHEEKFGALCAGTTRKKGGKKGGRREGTAH